MTITAEKARALLAGITPGPWNVTTPVPDAPEFRVIHHGDDGLSDFGKYMSVNGQVSLDDARAIAAVPDMLATIIAQDARITELEARENEWRSAFWVADQFAVAIHDDAGKFYSIRARDFHRMSDLYRRDVAASSAALNGETA